MDTYLLSFSTTAEDIGYLDLELRRERLHDSSRPLGFKKHIKWDRSQLRKTAFYRENREILDEKKGGGYWLWKPYIILDTLEKINDGDVVIYADSATYFISSPEEEIRQCIENKGFFLIHAYGHLCCQYTKRDTFHFMGLDTPYYHNAPITLGSPQIYRKNPDTLAFVKEWLHFCRNKNILTDLENISGKENLESYISHRHDMSVLSLLVAKYHIKTFIPIHDILNEEIRRMDDETIRALKQKYPQDDITYIYARVIICDRDNYGDDLHAKIRRLLNPKKLFFILYRKMQEFFN